MATVKYMRVFFSWFNSSLLSKVLSGISSSLCPFAAGADYLLGLEPIPKRTRSRSDYSLPIRDALAALLGI